MDYIDFRSLRIRREGPVWTVLTPFSRTRDTKRDTKTYGLGRRRNGRNACRLKNDSRRRCFVIVLDRFSNRKGGQGMIPAVEETAPLRFFISPNTKSPHSCSSKIVRNPPKRSGAAKLETGVKEFPARNSITVESVVPKRGAGGVAPAYGAG